MLKGDRRIAEFVKNTQWNEFPIEVRNQALKCIVDLFGAVIAGTMTRTAQLMCSLGDSFFKGGDASILMTGKKASLPGAVLVNGIAVNAFDVDDGHRIIKGHPGAAVFPALLAAAEYKDITYVEFLTSLVISYEVAIRTGLALHHYYGFYHGSGSWGAVGSASGAARIFGLDTEKILNALGIAEYNAPLAPVMRPVQFPTMNKDGIGWGTMSGMTAVLMAEKGYTGKPSVLDFVEYQYLVETLGSEYEIMNLYFKPYTCCRWAQPSISAAIELKNKYKLDYNEIEYIEILSFGAADSLYKERPRNTEEAQYNVSYPVAAALIAGEVGPRQVLEEYIGFPDVLSLMDRICLKTDERFEREFPKKRLCEVEIGLKDGCVLKSGVFGSAGEPDEPVTLEWIINKFKWLTRDVLDENSSKLLLDMLLDVNEKTLVRDIVSIVK